MKKIFLFAFLMLFGLVSSVQAQNNNDIYGKKMVKCLKNAGYKYSVDKKGIVTVDVALEGNRKQKVVIDPVEKYESDTTGYSIVSISAYVYGKDGIDANKLIDVLKQNKTLTTGSFAINDKEEKPYVYYGVFLGASVTPEELLENILFAASQADAMEQIFTPGVDAL